jgi:hypothetical protein
MNRRLVWMKPSKNGHRGLNEIYPLVELFYAGLRQNQTEGVMTLTTHKVEALLNEQALNKDLAGTMKSKRLRKEWAATKSLSTIDLLDTLVTLIPYELPKLKLDYFELHRQSIGESKQ